MQTRLQACRPSWLKLSGAHVLGLVEPAFKQGWLVRRHRQNDTPSAVAHATLFDISICSVNYLVVSNLALCCTIWHACRALPRLRQISIHAVPLTAGLAVALASGPRVEAVHLEPSNGLETFPAGVWEPLAQLGNRLNSMHLTVRMPGLRRAADPPMRYLLPAGLLALTGLGRLDMVLITADAFPATRLAGLEQTPLHTLVTDGGTPDEVWSCMQLTELHAHNDLIAMPATGHGTLPPLRTLDLDGWHARGFPAVLCGLSCLTQLTLSYFTFLPGAGLPPEVSQLR